jgi:RNA polymerase sigma-70 factor (ECF subfamily)
MAEQPHQCTSTSPYGAFPTTHWSLVARAGCESGEAKRAALGRLLEQYLPPMRAHLVFARRLDREQADELLQQFLADKVLGQDLVRRVERGRGRFRTFLLTVLEHFVWDRFRDAKSAQRRAGGAPASLDDPGAAAAAAAGAAVDPSPAPGQAFDVAWAKQVLAHAVDRMRQECESSSRPDVWAVFEGRVLRPTLHQQDPVPYGELVRRLGFASPTQASNVLVTANRMFVRVLRAVVGAYERDEGQIDEEIADLRRTLSGARAGPGPLPRT